MKYELGYDHCTRALLYHTWKMPLVRGVSRAAADRRSGRCFPSPYAEILVENGVCLMDNK
ncbi:MAG: hypothetical protein M2R45_02743 [Verrucomicrobia subdivision 3 bacterium]|nr:hypothetical protein [Limisphaerales bacterium]MCS1414293.1 hypothetical protein [Limisphaerales bacterium]